VLTGGCMQPTNSSGTGSSATPGVVAPAAPKRIVFAVPNPSDIRPTASLGPRQSVLPLIGAGLSSADGQGGRVPLLAVEIPSLANGRWRLNDDGTMVTTFSLRPEAMWHDGTPITADDFVFSLRVGRERRVPAFSGALYASIAGASAIASHTLQVDWSEPYNAADAIFDWSQSYGPPLPEHLLADSYGSNPSGLLDLPYWNQDYVGSGPIKVIA